MLAGLARKVNSLRMGERHRLQYQRQHQLPHYQVDRITPGDHYECFHAIGADNAEGCPEALASRAQFGIRQSDARFALQDDWASTAPAGFSMQISIDQAAFCLSGIETLADEAPIQLYSDPERVQHCVREDNNFEDAGLSCSR